MSVTLVHPPEQRAVSAHRLIDECALFKNNLGLLGAPYAIKSATSIEVFREFVSALNGEAIEITTVNFSGLSLLCTEFGFESLFGQLTAFRSSGAFSGGPAESEALGRLAVPERDRETAELRAELESLRAEVAALTARLAEAPNPSAAPAPPASRRKAQSAAPSAPPRSPANAASPPRAATIAPEQAPPPARSMLIFVKNRL
jgi:hypothetical protein